MGTGGESHYQVGDIQPNSQVRESNTFGVLKMTLRPGGYDWQFVPVAGKTLHGHAAPAPATEPRPGGPGLG